MSGVPGSAHQWVKLDSYHECLRLCCAQPDCYFWTYVGAAVGGDWARNCMTGHGSTRSAAEGAGSSADFVFGELHAFSIFSGCKHTAHPYW